MFRRHRDIPLERDTSTRFLPGLVAIMVFLLALAVSGLFLLRGATVKWESVVSGSVSVLLAPVTDPGLTQAERQAADAARLEALLAVLGDTPGVAAAELLGGETMARLLAPWLGRNDLVADLPLPQIVEVTLSRSVPLDTGRLEERLLAEIPGAELDDNRLWIENIDGLADYLEGVMAALMILVAGATVLAVVFVTRSGLAVHREVIELLHLIGAQDGYIAGQFSRHALRMGLRGGVIGLAGVAPVLVGLGVLAARVDQFQPLPLVSPWYGLALAALPPAAGLTAMVTARRTVLRALRHML